MNYYRILANCTEEQVCQLASILLERHLEREVKLLSGPSQGLVMLRVRETVANSLFNAGEVLVTEVKLELAGQFGFGMVIGDSPRRAMAIALIDASLRLSERLDSDEYTWLVDELMTFDQQIRQEQQRVQALVAMTKVNFERMEA